jgi:hypothetical protein
MHGPINVKSPNNMSKWQMGFNSAFKGLRMHSGCSFCVYQAFYFSIVRSIALRTTNDVLCPLKTYRYIADFRIIKKWNWLLVNGYEYKIQSADAKEFGNSFHGGTSALVSGHLDCVEK